MSVIAPPRQSDPVDRQEVEALVEALIEEARQRARRRRRVRMAVVAFAVLVGATLFAVFGRTAESKNSSSAFTAKSAATGGKVRLSSPARTTGTTSEDGSLAGIGTFRASGAVTDTGKTLAYRRVTSRGTLITLRFVTKGKKGTITYVVQVDTKAGNLDGRLHPPTGRTRDYTARGLRPRTRRYRQRSERNRVTLTSKS